MLQIQLRHDALLPKPVACDSNQTVPKWVPARSRLPVRPFLSKPIEKDINRNADDREHEYDREELWHPDERRIVGEPIAEPLSPADHLRSDRSQETEDRANHQSDDNHRHRHRNANFGEDLQGTSAERPRKCYLREIDPAKAGSRVDHHHWPAGQCDGDNARFASKAEA